MFEAPATETGWRIAVGFDTGASFFWVTTLRPLNISFFATTPLLNIRRVLVRRFASPARQLFKPSFHNSSGMLRVMEGDLDTIFRNFFRFEGIFRRTM